MKKKSGWIFILCFICSLGFQTICYGAVTTRVKDIARLLDVRPNQLNGYGLVVGLNGTGDTSRANIQTVVNVLTKWGYTVDAANLRLKNVAAVILTATLPPYMHTGDAIDVQVASFGDAKSIQGGILLQSPLFGADGNVYAVAQGPVYNGPDAAKRGYTNKSNTNSGMIQNGALVEREVPVQLSVNGKIRWALNKPDFTTASRLAQTINDNFLKGAARAVDMGLVEVTLPKDGQQDVISLIADIENLPVTPDGIAKVVINERTGTIVIGEKVKIAKVAVSYGNITVKVTQATDDPLTDLWGEVQGTGASAYGADTRGGYGETGNSGTGTETSPTAMIELPEGVDIGTIVSVLNMVGTTPKDIIAVLVAIEQAGALYGVLEFEQ